MLKQHRTALAFVMLGLLEMPRESSLWRLASAELAINFQWAERDPLALDRWLAAWEEAEGDEAGRQAVRDWRRGLAFARVAGLETLPYWLEQMRSSKAGTPMGDYIEGTVRELLAQHGTIILPGMAAPGPDGPLVLDPAAVARRWPRGASSAPA